MPHSWWDSSGRAQVCGYAPSPQASCGGPWSASSEPPCWPLPEPGRCCCIKDTKSSEIEVYMVMTCRGVNDWRVSVAPCVGACAHRRAASSAAGARCVS